MTPQEVFHQQQLALNSFRQIQKEFTDSLKGDLLPPPTVGVAIGNDLLVLISQQLLWIQSQIIARSEGAAKASSAE